MAKYSSLAPVLTRIILAAGITAAGALPASAHGVAAPEGEIQGAPEEKPGLDILSLLFGSAQAMARFTISESDGKRLIEADGLPDHATGRFPNRNNPNAIKSQRYRFSMPLDPKPAGRITQIGHMPFGVALNGVVFDPLTAEYWKNDRRSGWNIDALSGVLLGLDSSNAHVQPDGSYHYHGVPEGLLKLRDQGQGPVLLGYAADGFPIYGPDGYQEAGKAAGALMVLKPSWKLKDGNRPGGSSGPGGRYDGTYVQDFEYVAGLGDLDQCNGRSGVTPDYPDGTYYYVISNSFPYVPRCFTGTVDDSFKRRPGMGQRPGGDGEIRGEGTRRIRDSRRRQQGPQMGQGMGQGMGGRPGGPPDLQAAADRLGISAQELRRALGPPPPDFEAAAAKLGVSAEELFQALHPPQ